MTTPDVTDHSGQTATNTLTQEQYGVPALVVTVLCFLVVGLFFHAIWQSYETGRLQAHVETLQREVKGYQNNLTVAELEKTRRLEDELRAQIDAKE